MRAGAQREVVPYVRSLGERINRTKYAGILVL